MCTCDYILLTEPHCFIVKLPGQSHRHSLLNGQIKSYCSLLLCYHWLKSNLWIYLLKIPTTTATPHVLIEGWSDMCVSLLDVLAVTNKHPMLSFIFDVKFDGFLALVTPYIISWCQGLNWLEIFTIKFWWMLNCIFTHTR